MTAKDRQLAGAKLGGKRRAKALTAAQRSDIARRGGFMKWANKRAKQRLEKAAS